MLEITQENLLPALDRCNVILSNLQGLAQYHEHSPAFDVPASAFSLILDIIRCIRLLGHHILLFASEEHRRFLAFSKWLRYAIDFQAADPTSATGLELIERDPGLDSALVLTYIRGGLEHSKIDGLLSAPADAPEIHANSDMYIDLTKGLDAFKNNKPCKGDILKLSSYYTEWCKRNQTLVDHITSWQRVNTLMPGGLVLVDSNISRCDLRMVFEVRFSTIQ